MRSLRCRAARVVAVGCVLALFIASAPHSTDAELVDYLTMDSKIAVEFTQDALRGGRLKYPTIKPGDAWNDFLAKVATMRPPIASVQNGNPNDEVTINAEKFSAWLSYALALYGNNNRAAYQFNPLDLLDSSGARGYGRPPGDAGYFAELLKMMPKFMRSIVRNQDIPYDLLAALSGQTLEPIIVSYDDQEFKFYHKKGPLSDDDKLIIQRMFEFVQLHKGVVLMPPTLPYVVHFPAEVKKKFPPMPGQTVAVLNDNTFYVSHVINDVTLDGGIFVGRDEEGSSAILHAMCHEANIDLKGTAGKFGLDLPQITTPPGFRFSEALAEAYAIALNIALSAWEVCVKLGRPQQYSALAMEMLEAEQIWGVIQTAKMMRVAGMQNINEILTAGNGVKIKQRAPALEMHVVKTAMLWNIEKFMRLIAGTVFGAQGEKPAIDPTRLWNDMQKHGLRDANFRYNLQIFLADLLVNRISHEFIRTTGRISAVEVDPKYAVVALLVPYGTLPGQGLPLSYAIGPAAKEKSFGAIASNSLTGQAASGLPLNSITGMNSLAGSLSGSALGVQGGAGGSLLSGLATGGYGGLGTLMGGASAMNSPISNPMMRMGGMGLPGGMMGMGGMGLPGGLMGGYGGGFGMGMGMGMNPAMTNPLLSVGRPFGMVMLETSETVSKRADPPKPAAAAGKPAPAAAAKPPATPAPAAAAAAAGNATQGAVPNATAAADTNGNSTQGLNAVQQLALEQMAALQANAQQAGGNLQLQSVNVPNTVVTNTGGNTVITSSTTSIASPAGTFPIPELKTINLPGGGTTTTATASFGAGVDTSALATQAAQQAVAAQLQNAQLAAASRGLPSMNPAMMQAPSMLPMGVPAMGGMGAMNGLGALNPAMGAMNMNMGLGGIGGMGLGGIAGNGLGVNAIASNPQLLGATGVQQATNTLTSSANVNGAPLPALAGLPRPQPGNIFGAAGKKATLVEVDGQGRLRNGFQAPAVGNLFIPNVMRVPSVLLETKEKAAGHAKQDAVISEKGALHSNVPSA